MKIKTHVKSGGLKEENHNQTLRVKRAAVAPCLAALCE